MQLAMVTILACLSATAQDAPAQSPVDANWIWAGGDGDPAVSAPVGKVWFRHEVRSFTPASTGIIHIACDDHFVLWVNGKRIGEGGGDKSYRFLLSGIVGRGLNVIAVEATNRDGRDGLLVDGQIRWQTGAAISLDSGDQWLATRKAPTDAAWRSPRFEDAAWKPIRVLGSHDSSPWKAIQFRAGETDDFAVRPGFVVRRVAEPELVGAVPAITWGHDGRLIASRQYGPILTLSDTDGDGTFDEVHPYSDAVTDCQGLCMVRDDLYAVGSGPQGTGMYRLPDRNRDGRADEVHLIVRHDGQMHEHGPHAVVFGPDGWLYHAVGNNVPLLHKPEPASPLTNLYEGDLPRPRFLVVGGAYRHLKAPQGTIWRFTPDGKRWWLQAGGFRNHYDIAFDERGELFTFDSDRENEVGSPWYRPVRVCHCIPGADFGFRTDSAKWPPYYFDSLPATIDIGRGSPTGMVFYNHRQFPQRYRGALLVGDWAMGRIISLSLQPQGATFTAVREDLLTGNPLNVTDMEVDRDGSLIFSTGGRSTQGGIYRLSYTGPDAQREPPPARTVQDALAMPQIQAGWAREAVGKIKRRVGDRWESALVAKARDGDSSEQVRALSLLAQLGPRPST